MIRREAFTRESPASTTATVFREDWADLLTHGIRTGDPASSVKLIEFADFECPFCARYHDAVGSRNSVTEKGCHLIENAQATTTTSLTPSWRPVASSSSRPTAASNVTTNRTDVNSSATVAAGKSSASSRAAKLPPLGDALRAACRGPSRLCASRLHRHPLAQVCEIAPRQALPRQLPRSSAYFGVRYSTPLPPAPKQGNGPSCGSSIVSDGDNATLSAAPCLTCVSDGRRASHRAR